MIVGSRDLKVIEKGDAQPDLVINKDLLQLDKMDSELIFCDADSVSQDVGDVAEQEGGGATSEAYPENTTGNNENEERSVETATYSPNLRHTARFTTGNPPKRFGYEQNSIVVRANKTNESLPAAYDETLSGADSKKWLEAFQLEFQSLSKLETWELADLSLDRKHIKNKWVFDVKTRWKG